MINIKFSDTTSDAKNMTKENKAGKTMKWSELQRNLLMSRIIIQLCYLRTIIILASDVTIHFTVHDSGIEHFICWFFFHLIFTYYL